VSKGRKTSAELFKGRVRALRALGYVRDKSGRVRKNGKSVRTEEVERSVSKLDAQKKRSLARTKLIPGLERTTEKKKLEGFTIKEAAEWTGRSPRTVQKWIREGGTPPEALDTIRAKLSGERAYKTEWDHGQKSKVSTEDRKKLQRALRMFVQGKRKRSEDLAERYKEWYATKKKLRDKLTKKAWKALMQKIGKAEGLPNDGTFSVMRLILS
jgi:DNA-binding transcriptional MerR regulator